jgi:hypothetical protein
VIISGKHVKGFLIWFPAERKKVDRSETETILALKTGAGDLGVTAPPGHVKCVEFFRTSTTNMTELPVGNAGLITEFGAEGQK